MRRVGYNLGMDVRTFVAADLEPALALWDRTEHLGSVTPADVRRLLDRDAELVLVATDDHGEIIGAVLGSFDGRRGWINRLAVDPAARRSGVGRALVAEVERRLAARGCPQVNLLMFGDNHTGRALWESLGYDGPGELVMFSKRLADADAGADPC